MLVLELCRVGSEQIQGNPTPPATTHYPTSITQECTTQMIIVIIWRNWRRDSVHFLYCKFCYISSSAEPFQIRHFPTFSSVSPELWAELWPELRPEPELWFSFFARACACRSSFISSTTDCRMMFLFSIFWWRAENKILLELTWEQRWICLLLVFLKRIVLHALVLWFNNVPE